MPGAIDHRETEAGAGETRGTTRARSSAGADGEAPGRTDADADGEARRPSAVLLVYSWDLVLAILAVFGALAAFGGHLVVGDREFDVPLPMQILSAVSSASYAAALVIVATLLTRRLRWVSQAQIVLMGAAIALSLVSVATARVIGGGHTDYPALLGNLLFVLIDAVVILVMTGRGIRDWYTGAGAVPLYVQGTIAFWASSGAALIVFQAFR